MDGNSTEHAVYCGVVIVNGIMAGLNMLLLTWLGRNRQRADAYKTLQYGSIMRRLDAIEDRCQKSACKMDG